MVAWLLLLLSFALRVPLALEANSATESHTGDTVTLHCPGRPLKDREELLWTYEGKPFSLNDDGYWYQTGRHVNRTRPVSIQQNCLVITDVRKEDAGVYACRQRGHTEDVQSIRLFVNDAETNREQREAGTQHGGASSGGSRGLTVAIVVPVVFGVFVVLVVVGVLIIKRRNTHGAERQEESGL